jgi:two-component system sensor histidine kinase KdpD
MTEQRRLLEEQTRLLEEAQRMTQALTAANQAKDEFLGMVSHELRTPLTTILGNAQLLTRSPDLLQPNERRGVSDDIYKESIRLTNIVENLLLMARFDQGQRLELEPVILRRLSARVVADVGRVSSHQFESDFPRGIIPVLGNAVCIEQVMRNLISNAEKYSPAGSLIELSIHEEGDSLIYSVADSGVGLNPEEVERVFEPFFRSESSSFRSGVGIGLAVCRRLIEAMGGRIWASPRAGGGSIFSFALPRADA